MKRKAFKKVLAVVLVGAMAAGITVSASAAEGHFDAPTSEMEVDPNYGTAAVHRAASVLPEILGLSTVSGFSTINGGMPTTLDGAEGSLMLGAFGTNMNDNPDPFYYNLFYNFYAAENGLELSQHAMLNDNNVSASPGGADRAVIDGYGTSISLAGRPDMLIGTAIGNENTDLTGYDEMIAEIRTGAIGEDYYQEGDEDYAPYLVAYTFTYTYDMVVVANTVAYLMDNYMVDDGKYGRYSIQVLGENGKTAMDIAQDLGDYVCGISTYVQSKIASGDVEKKASAVISGIDAEAGTISLANSDSQSATSNNRIAEYCELVTDNIANTEIGTSATIPEVLDNADAIVFSSSNYNTLLTAVQAYDEANGTDYEDVLDEKVIINNYPDSVYGITMNSIENTMGFGYYVGFLYCDELPEINPVYMCAYFYQNFYHVSDLTNVQNIVNTTFQDVNPKPTGVTTDLENYSASAIYDDLMTGKDYYYANFADYAETALAEVWQEDRDAGIKINDTWKVYDSADDVLALQAAIDDANALNEDDYTADSWAALQTAVADAQAVADSENPSQDAIKAAIAELKDAEDNLVTTTDAAKADLQKAIDEAEALNKDGYTADSWDALQDAVDNAKEVLDNEEASSEDLEAALEEVKTAMDNLEPVTSPLNGVVKGPDGKWGYYVNNELQKNYTGVAPVKNDNGWWYIKDGYVDFSANTVAKNDNGWWYVKNGKVDFSANTVAKNDNGWWYIVGGKVDFSYTGVANYKNANGWWYISGGKVDFSKNSVEKNKNGWWLVEGGKVNFNYTGVANYKNANGWWYVKGGKVDFSANTVAKNNNGWWYVTGGKVQFGFTGLAHYKNANGWWYIKNGKVDFTYNGRATNQNGTYNVRNGKVVF